MVKPWREMTRTEIVRLKQQQCTKCVYFSLTGRVNADAGHCNYILQAGHSRGCSPLECKEKGIFQPKVRRRRKGGRIE